MKPHTLRALLRGAVCGSLLTASLPASAAEFHYIQDVFSATYETDYYDAYNLIEGPEAGFSTEPPYARLSGLTWVTADVNGLPPANYFDPLPDPAPKLVFDLGSDVFLAEISVWGYATGIEGNSMKDFSLRFATASEGPDGAGTSITFNPTFSAGPEVARHSFMFGQGVKARYVELTPLSNNVGLGPGGDRVGFSEVAFEAIPETSEPRVDLANATIALGDSSVLKPFALSVRNLGAQPLTFSGATFTGAGASAYSVVDVPASVGPYSQATIQLQYNPAGQAPGAINATFRVNTNDPETPVLEVPVSANLPATPPDLFYPIVSATSTTDATDYYKIPGLIEGPGVGFNPEQPHNQLSTGKTWVTNAPNGGTGDYFDPAPEPTPVLVLDLGQDVPLGEISVWAYNVNGNSTKDFSLRFATEAEGPDNFGTSITYNPTFIAAFGFNNRQSFEFSQVVTARYVEVTPLDNYYDSGEAGGDRVGLGEVAFEQIVITPGRNLLYPSSVNLGTTLGPATTSLVLKNYGTETLTLSSLTVTGAHGAFFTIKNPPASLPPVSQVLVELEFTPDATTPEGRLDAALSVVSDAPGSPTVLIPFAGRYFSPEPDTFYPIMAVTSATDATDFYYVDNLIAGIGYGFMEEQPHDQIITNGPSSLWVTEAPNGSANYYDPAPEITPLLTFDLGSDVELTEISVWGYSRTNSNGVRDFSLTFATSAEGPENAGTSITYNPTFTVPHGDVERHSFRFTQAVTARYVLLKPLNNWGGMGVAPGGDRVGLGEVAFEMGAATAPPVTSFAITSISVPAAGQVKITFESEAGVNYTVSRSTDLATWTPVATVAGAAGSTDYTDTTVPNNAPRVFYRVSR